MPIQRLYIFIQSRVNMLYLGIVGAILAAIFLNSAQSQVDGDVPNTSSELNFGPVNFGGYNNYVYRDNTTAVQVVISECVPPFSRYQAVGTDV